MDERVEVSEPSSVGEARRVALTLCDELVLSEEDAGRVALVVTEAATNIVRHAGGTGGELLLRLLGRDQPAGIEILALDKGPGMRHVGECLRDGYTTAGSRGVGLGAMVRQSDFFDIFSSPDRGTALLMHVLRSGTGEASPPPPRGADASFGVVAVPLRGEQVSGDGWAVHLGAQRTVVLVVDGLGHGPEAHRATTAALRAFARNHDNLPEEVLIAIHGALRTTRGAVGAVAEIDWRTRQLRYAGVGNISGRILEPGGRGAGLVSHHGTLGKTVGRTRAFTHAWPDEGLLVMQSDGVSRRWDLDEYPGLAMKHPSLIAAVLYRDYVRRRDDSVVVVVREPNARRVTRETEDA